MSYVLVPNLERRKFHCTIFDAPWSLASPMLPPNLFHLDDASMNRHPVNHLIEGTWRTKFTLSQVSWYMGAPSILIKVDVNETFEPTMSGDGTRIASSSS